MNIEKLVSDNYYADTKCIDLGGKLQYLTNDEKLEVIRYIGDNYPDLQKLYLGINKITKLDNSLDKLVNLRWLSLSWNKIKSLDNSLDKLVNLRKLYIHRNKIPLVQIYNYVIFTEKLTMIFY